MPAEVQELLCRKEGRPLLLPDKLDHQVHQYIKELCTRGVVINSVIVIAIAKGIIMNKDANLLSCNGGGINVTTDWAKSLLTHMGFVERKAAARQKWMLANFSN